MIQWQALFVALYPFCFIEMDGYHVLVDLLGMPTLKHDAVHFVRHSLWDRIRSGAGLNRQEVIFVSLRGALDRLHRGLHLAERAVLHARHLSALSSSWS